MANSYFKFKQFTVWQDKCAMKVGTIASLFGALVECDDPKSILDIGTGTGLLSLMTAQKFPNAVIDGIEIDPEAYQQSISNYKESNWNYRLNVVLGDFLNHSFDKKYDLIISNPPFFKHHLKAKSSAVNMARHNDHFELEEFIRKVEELLKENGRFWLLMPTYEMIRTKKYLEGISFFEIQKIEIMNYHDSPSKAVVCAFSKCRSKPTIKKIAIRETQQKYTPEFEKLMEPFYLHL